MSYSLNEEQSVEIATLLILMLEAGGEPSTVENLKFCYSRASWCDDFSSEIIQKRGRRIDVIIKNSISPKKYLKSALQLKLIAWDD